jgi:hypothetical protein
MKDDTCMAKWDRPVIGLVKVIVESNYAPRNTISTIALNHLSALGKPFPPIVFNKIPALITIFLRSYDYYSGNFVRRYY